MKKLLIWIILCSICTAVPAWGDEGTQEMITEPCTEAIAETEIECMESAECLDFQEEPAVSAEPEAQPIKNRWGIALTPSEIDLLARIVMLEAGGEGILGQQAVTEVIFNRMVSSCYGGSLEHVLGAKGQFSTWKNRYSSRAVPTQQVLISVLSVLNGETNILPANTLYFSRKAQNRRIQTKIGRHIFCNQ